MKKTTRHMSGGDGGRKGLSKRPRTASPSRNQELWVELADVGRVRMIRRVITSPEAEPIVIWDYDPDFQPEIPKGALRADIRKQNHGCGAPKFYYQDRIIHCRDCPRGTTFLFDAQEQKYWYETRAFILDSVPIRCPTHRLQEREHKRISEIYAKCIHDAMEHPNDPEILTALAEATWEYRKATGRGDLNRGIAVARKAMRAHFRGCHKPLFLEAQLQVCAGRTEQAVRNFERFLQALPACPDCSVRRREALSYLKDSSNR